MSLEKKFETIDEKNFNEHEKLVRYYLKRLTDSPIEYGIISTHKEYGPNYRVIGEMDLMACRKKKMFIFEMKSNNSTKSRNTAKKQLRKARKYFSNMNVYTFYVTPNKIKLIR